MNNDEAWRERAECRKAPDKEIFFERDDERRLEFVARTEKAMQYCGPCPVRDQCLNFALENHIVDNIYGGLSGSRRRRLLQRMYREEQKRASSNNPH